MGDTTVLRAERRELLRELVHLREQDPDAFEVVRAKLLELVQAATLITKKTG